MMCIFICIIGYGSEFSRQHVSSRLTTSVLARLRSCFVSVEGPVLVGVKSGKHGGLTMENGSLTMQNHGFKTGKG